MEFVSAKEAAAKWNVHIRLVQDLCKNGRVPGAKKLGANWIIPANADKPGDPRRLKNAASRGGSAAPLPRQTPFFIISDLYGLPGTADAVTASLAAQPEAAALFAAQLAYLRGEIDTVYESAPTLLCNPSGFDSQIGAGLLLLLCAMYRGDLSLWTKAKQYIADAPCGNEAERERLTFWLAAADSAINDNTGFPPAFCRGCFDFLPKDSFAIARFYYVKYLYVAFNNSITEQTQADESLHHEHLLHLLPTFCELLISQTRAEGVVVAEIYLCLLCAIAYHNRGDDEAARIHIDRALALALPDKLYAPLAEHSRMLDFLLFERLNAVDPAASRAVKELNKRLLDGWVKLHNALLNRHISNALTTREREVARFAVYGLSNREIAQRLCISVDAVKHAIRSAMNKTGAKNRRQMAGYI